MGKYVGEESQGEVAIDWGGLSSEIVVVSKPCSRGEKGRPRPDRGKSCSVVVFPCDNDRIVIYSSHASTSSRSGVGC